MTASSLNILKKQFGYRPVWAAELEFYISDSVSEASILDTLDEICRPHFRVEKERGKTQYEVATTLYEDTETFITRVNHLRKIIGTHLEADFSAKPFADDYGSALHFHLHLEDEAGNNLFTRNEQGEYSAALLHTLGGLLHLLPQQLGIFSPNDTKRFSVYGKHAPTHLSWGPNNRSVALRLPDKPLDNKHIEHRVASADADIHDCVEAILQGIIYGLTHQSDPGNPIYGNAWDTQYKLAKLLA